MPGNVSGSIGNQPVELNNAATESTLAALLSITQKTNPAQLALMKKIAESSGISPAVIKQVTDGLENLNRASTGASQNILGVNKFGAIVGAIAQDLTIGVVKTGQNLMELGSTVMGGSAKMSDFFKSMKDLPLGIGLIAGLFQQLSKIQEENLDAYRNISDAGINFSGSLTDLRQASADSYLTMSQFESVMKSNSATFAKMGDTVDAGAQAFVKLSKSLISGNLGAQLLAAGYNFEQINNGIASYIALTGGRSEQELKDTKALTKSAADYMMQLDKLAELTGQSRQEQEKQLKEATANAAFEAKLQGMSEADRSKAMLAMQNALAIGGKGAADALKSQILGLPPMTEEAQKFIAVNAQTAEGIRQMGVAALDSTKTTSDVNRGAAAAMMGTTKDINRLGQTATALSMMQGSTAQAAMKAQETANLMRQKGFKTEEELFAFLEKEKNLRNDQAQAVSEAQRGLKELGAALWGALNPAIKALTPAMTGLTNMFTALFKDKDTMQKFGEYLGTLITEMGNYAKNLFSEEGRQKILNDLKYGFQVLMLELKQMILGKGFFGISDKEKAEQLKELNQQPAGDNAGGGYRRTPMSAPVAGRALGSFGSTGSLFENFGAKKTVELHGMEAVVTPDQMSKLMQGSAATGIGALAGDIQQLNAMTSQVLRTLMTIADNTKRGVDATKSLNGNLFAR